MVLCVRDDGNAERSSHVGQVMPGLKSVPCALTSLTHGNLLCLVFRAHNSAKCNKVQDASQASGGRIVDGANIVNAGSEEGTAK